METRTIEGIERKEIYHEKQRLQFCLLHSLNNLFQESNAFTREQLNAIADRLILNDPNKDSKPGICKWVFSFFQRHDYYNPTSGNYDVNVLITAMEGRGKKVAWHDQRKKASSIDLDDPEGKLNGIVLNIVVKKFCGLLKGRHWVALRKIHGFWYNLDSELSRPYKFRNDVEVRKFLDSTMAAQSQVLLILN
ncbi:josephin-like protein [Impatiens glandulifera]|uniref:josephin-like protein n=1 Tax=Impatiens glandulifera TaxID=253017 RepID=UPI001FB10678|nr:josephin-like protein [Impatiens glandulifera]